jgi:hypothetical protein
MHVFQVRRSVCMRERKTTHPPADRTPTIIHQQQSPIPFIFNCRITNAHAHCSTNIALDIIIGFGACGDAFPYNAGSILCGAESTHFSPLIACALALAAEPSNFNLADDLLFVDCYNLSPVHAGGQRARSKVCAQWSSKRLQLKIYIESCHCMIDPASAK